VSTDQISCMLCWLITTSVLDINDKMGASGIDY
jgi:hypothetical protein